VRECVEMKNRDLPALMLLKILPRFRLPANAEINCLKEN
jgi:hypothetical protein